MQFKTRIKELRARYDTTQDDLARQVGVRRETIVYLEKGMYNLHSCWRSRYPKR